MCATTVLSEAQALFAALAGADYIAPYVQDVDDIGYDGFALLASILKMLQPADMHARVLAAAIKTPQDMVRVATMGAELLTVNYASIMAACARTQPLSDHYFALFDQIWKENGCSFV